MLSARVAPIFENKPPPQFGPCLLLNGGGGAYFREDTVLRFRKSFQGSHWFAVWFLLVDLTENTEVDWFCITSHFRLVTLSGGSSWWANYISIEPHAVIKTTYWSIGVPYYSGGGTWGEAGTITVTPVGGGIVAAAWVPLLPAYPFKGDGTHTANKGDNNERDQYAKLMCAWP